mmetsp:Transcript_16536/g.38990  ORF Transcript_16536/g.38990 Transcript_16536/m.38990 type:complete len:264 (-) Transcript_16536:95-886(-)
MLLGIVEGGFVSEVFLQLEAVVLGSHHEVGSPQVWHAILAHDALPGLCRVVGGTARPQAGDVGHVVDLLAGVVESDEATSGIRRHVQPKRRIQKADDLDVGGCRPKDVWHIIQVHHGTTRPSGLTAQDQQMPPITRGEVEALHQVPENRLHHTGTPKLKIPGGAIAHVTVRGAVADEDLIRILQHGIQQVIQQTLLFDRLRHELGTAKMRRPQTVPEAVLLAVAPATAFQVYDPGRAVARGRRLPVVDGRAPIYAASQWIYML